MSNELYIKIIDERKFTIGFGKSRLYIEIYGDDDLANFRVVGMGDEDDVVQIKVDKNYNARQENRKVANFIIK
jgi:hypothetical protein